MDSSPLGFHADLATLATAKIAYHLASSATAGYGHLFTTVQSFRSRRILESQGAQYWEYVVLDEAHHVPADSYRDIISSLRPRILLGLTGHQSGWMGKASCRGSMIG